MMHISLDDINYVKNLSRELEDKIVESVGTPNVELSLLQKEKETNNYGLNNTTQNWLIFINIKPMPLRGKAYQTLTITILKSIDKILFKSDISQEFTKVEIYQVESLFLENCLNDNLENKSAKLISQKLKISVFKHDDTKNLNPRLIKYLAPDLNSFTEKQIQILNPRNFSFTPRPFKQCLKMKQLFRNRFEQINLSMDHRKENLVFRKLKSGKEGARSRYGIIK